MEIREALDSDLPQLITLLKSSLGEKLIPKSEEFFLWKHRKNIFGSSKTLIASVDQRIVGLRTFMYWNWVKGSEKIIAVRAVDTATDPAYQGKGIFRNLTMKAVELCISEGVGMVFNTPNPVSRQGYLKMGWEVAGRLPVYIGPGSIFPSKWNTDTDNKVAGLYSLKKGETFPLSDKVFHTPLSNEFIQWRYSECPVVKYGGVTGEDYGFIFRLKPVRQFMEMRICEVWCNNERNLKELDYEINQCIKKLKPLMVTCAESPLLNGRKSVKGLWGPFKKGPVTTIRPLMITDMNSFSGFSNWQPSLGSLELF